MTISSEHNPHITGTQINYYFVCHRKLWLFCHHIQMEHTSEFVEMGSLLHEHSYIRKRKEIQIGGIKIDFFDKNRGVINEVKKSKAIEESHIWQLKYYIYFFKKLGMEVTGQIDYPLIRKRENVQLQNGDEKRIENIMEDIHKITASEKPPDVIDKKFCKKCSYYELCYI